MKPKTKFFVVFLIAACLAMFAHTLVPHHHHDSGIICFCQHSHELTPLATDEDDHSSCCHSHGCEQDLHCTTTSFYLTPSQSGEEEKHDVSGASHADCFCLLTVIFQEFSVPAAVIAVEFPPPIDHLCAFDGRTTSGLRAPPFIA